MVCTRDSFISLCIEAQGRRMVQVSWNLCAMRSSKDSGSFCLDFLPSPGTLFCLYVWLGLSDSVSGLLPDGKWKERVEDMQFPSKEMMQKLHVLLLLLGESLDIWSYWWEAREYAYRLGDQASWTNSGAVAILILNRCSWNIEQNIRHIRNTPQILMRNGVAWCWRFRQTCAGMQVLLPT